MKRFLSLALALVMVLGMVPAMTFAAEATPALPTAKVSQITNDDLTFAMNFRVDSVTEEQLAYYGSWYADFELTVNKEVTFNNDGSADGWLAGQYDKWSFDWITVPAGKFAPVTVKANEPVKIMAFAAEHMDEPGLKYTFKEVYETVRDFNCGVYFDDEFLLANPDLVVTLELKMYNPANEAEGYVIGETYTYTNPAVAKNATTGKVYSSITEAMLECVEGQTVVLLKDTTETLVSVFDDMTLDLNGHALAASYVTSYGDIIDSSADNTGVLCVPTNRLYLRNDNAQLPINDGTGYRFAQVLKIDTRMLSAYKLAFQPRIEPSMQNLLVNGADVTGVTIQVKVTWKQGDGYRSQNFVYNDSFVKGYLSSYDAATDKYSKMFTLTLNAAEDFEELTFTAVIVSETKVSFTPDSIQEQKPTGNVTTNAQNQVVNDVTIGSGNASALVPSGTQLENGAYNVTLNATEMEKTTSNITLGDGEQLVSMNVHVDGVAANNTKPIIVTLENLANEGLNQNNIALYHVENGETVLMTRVYSIDEVDAHNEYYYDIATGTVTMALATFSEIALRSNPDNPWDGSADTSWYTEGDSELIISNAEQLAGLGQLVDGGTTFEGETIYLGFDIDLEGYNGENRISFNPIGFGYDIVFKGTIQGQGHTIRNLYQNGWDLGLSYSTAGGGLFASVVDAEFYDLTLDNAYVVMECIDMGALVGYAYGTCHFENIVVSNSIIANYNRYTGGVVGEVNGTHTFINVDVPDSTKISALWGTFDPAIGGIIGGVYGGAEVTMKLCDVAAVLDVFNDVTSAYRWYSYRRCGMLIGYTEESKTENGRTEATASFLTTENCTVQYGDWVNYTYCQFSAENYPFVRVQGGLFNDPCSNPRYGHPVGADGNKVSDPEHEFFPAHNVGESHGLSVVFHQLYGGGQGCYGGNGHVGEGVTEITEITAEEKFTAKIPQGMTLIAGKTYTLGELFAASGAGAQIQNLSVNAYVSPVSVENVGNVSGTFVRENNWADSTLTLNGSGAATITISDYYYSIPVTIEVNVGTVTPGLFHQTTTVKDGAQYAIVIKMDGKYYALSHDDTNTRINGYEVTVENGILSDTQTPAWKVIYKDGKVQLQCNENQYLYYAGPKTEIDINSTAYDWELVSQNNGSFYLKDTSGQNRAVAYQSGANANYFRVYALSNSKDSNYAFDLYFFELVSCLHENTENREGQDATCTENGYESGVYCQDCGVCISGGEVIAAIGHNYTSEVTTAAGCETTGEKTYTCSNCGDSYTESIEATGHNYTGEVTTAAGCETTGEKTYTCSNCGDSYTESIEATGHTYVDGKCECGATQASKPAGWYLVTDVTELKVGDKIIIVAKDYNYALSTTQNTNNRGQAAVTKSGNTLSFTTAPQELTLQAGTTTGTFALYTGSGYLYAASSSGNQLKTQKTNNANGSWKITIAADGTATIKAQGSYTRNVMQYNQGSSLFACYSSASQKALVIYKYVEGSTGGGDEHTHSYTEQITTAATCTTDGVKTFTCSCGESYTETISALGHTIENGKCTTDGCDYTENSGTTSGTATLNIYANKGTLSSKDIKWTSGIVSFNVNQGGNTNSINTSDSNLFRVYASNKVTITATGANITQFVITCTSSNYATALKNSLSTSDYEVSVSNAVVTVKVKNPASSITFTASAQFRMNKLEVTYA